MKNSKGKTTMKNHLAEKALLVDVRITVWTARVKDKRAAAALEKANNAEQGLGTYTKSLVSKEAINNINAVVKVARRKAEEITLPWGDDGTRLLPAERWAVFEDEMAMQEKKFFEAVDEFMAGYEEHRKAQARKRMGTLYDSNDYIAPELVRKRFKFKIDYVPFPSADDVRVNLDKDQVKEIEDSIREQANAKMVKAMSDLFYRVHQAAETIHGQLADPAQIIRRHTHDHIKKLVDILPALNVAGDARLAAAAKQLHDQVVMFDRDDLQENNGGARDRAAKAAKNVVSTIGKGLDSLNKELRRLE